MKTYELTLNVSFVVEAKNEENAYNKLGERFARENMTAENEFWDNIEVKEIEKMEDNLCLTESEFKKLEDQE